MEAIIHIKLDDESLIRTLQNDIFNILTTDNLKIYDEYVNDVIIMDKDEKLTHEIANK